MKAMNWDPEKNLWLMKERGVSFEMAIEALAEGRVLNAFINKRGQPCFVVLIHDYPHVVVTVESETEIFFKTIFPDRRYK